MNPESPIPNVVAAPQQPPSAARPASAAAWGFPRALRCALARIGRGLQPFSQGPSSPLSAAAVAAMALALGNFPLLAFPPAPMHRVVGMVRTEMGDPLNLTNAVVVLETLSGIQAKTKVTPNIGPGRNYVLNVPMDAGITHDNYRAGALRSAASYRMKVQVGGVTFLPLETRVVPATLGRPAQSTRMDLTLGEDLDGDGIPDAWERALLAMLGSSKSIREVQPDDDSDGDGISNLNEYRAGTYPFDPSDGFELKVVQKTADRLSMEFLAIAGRRYAVRYSTDLAAWSGAGFRFSTDAAGSPLRQDFTATRTQLLRIDVPSDGVPGNAFFRATVQ